MPENWRRELQGALVYYGDGAVVTKVSFPSDFSAVRISNLPQDTNASSVVELLTTHGFVVQEDCVRIAAPKNNAHGSVDVRVEDAQFAKHLCEILAAKGADAPRAVPINASMPQTTNYRRVDSKKVYCSWHKATKTAWLNFGIGDTARQVGSNFSAGAYKVLSQKVQCAAPTRSTSLTGGRGYTRGGWLPRGRDDRNPSAWTIRLSDVPSLAQKGDVTRNISAKLAPNHVELSASSYHVDLPTANTSIESLLLQSGPLERWEGALEGAGKRFKAKAWFMNDEDARQATMSLNNTPLPFNKNGKLTVQLVHSARLKIPTRVYDAVEQEIAEHKQAWVEQHLVYIAYPPSQSLRVLKLEGESREDVAKAKDTLEAIIGGEVLMSDGEAVWSPSFAANGPAFEKMRQLERELGILIVRDKRRSRIRLLGPRRQRQEAQQALTELSKADSSSTHVIELDAKQLSRAVKGGYQAIVAAIGKDKVSVDITTRRISVTGSELDHRAAREILRGKDLESWAKQEGGSIAECAICWTEAENPVQTSCKHVYCASCFENLCLAGVDPGPSIQCQGDAGNCRKVVLKSELQAHLPSAALEDVLETAFATHLARNLNPLKNCPTPDCSQIYRTAKPSENQGGASGTGESPLITCPSCLKVVCTACNASHDGQTCAEHRDLVSLGASKDILGIKNCPGCGIMIEKTSGCNHMTCRNCQTHLCWVCLETFSEGQLVYTHMRRQHGGIGVAEFPHLA